MFTISEETEANNFSSELKLNGSGRGLLDVQAFGRKDESPQSGGPVLKTEIRTQYLPNTSQERCSYVSTFEQLSDGKGETEIGSNNSSA
jgi:hypothetical protein